MARERFGAAHWREVLDTWRGSGVSLHAFAKHQGLNYLSLRYWRRKLESPGEAASGESSDGLPAVFVPLTVAAEPMAEVVVAGVTLRLPLAASADQIGRWLAAARSSC